MMDSVLAKMELLARSVIGVPRVTNNQDHPLHLASRCPPPAWVEDHPGGTMAGAATVLMTAPLVVEARDTPILNMMLGSVVANVQKLPEKSTCENIVARKELK